MCETPVKRLQNPNTSQIKEEHLQNKWKKWKWTQADKCLEVQKINQKPLILSKWSADLSKVKRFASAS